MKKRYIYSIIVSLALGIAMLGGGLSQAATDTQTTELTMTMESTYTLSVPAKTAITYGTASTSIGDVTVTGNVASDKVVNVVATKSDFVSGNNSFSYALNTNGKGFTSDSWSSADIAASKKVSLTVDIDNATWESVVPGEYTSSIVFEASIGDAAIE